MKKNCLIPLALALAAGAASADTLKKVVASTEWQENYIKRNLLTPVEWPGEEGAAYLDSLRGKYEKALGGLYWIRSVSAVGAVLGITTYLDLRRRGWTAWACAPACR